ncbi:MAG TPA: iron ABC transporter permease [Chloroflexota bacterium]|nr:iron ABC transporter permease [Chloroflexota bacterium]
MSIVADTRVAGIPIGRRLGAPTSGGLFSVGVLAVLALLIGIPTLAVLIMSLRTGLPGQARPLTFANFAEVFTDPFTGQVMGNTLAFAVATIGVTLLFAVPLVWLMTRTDLPGKETIYVLMTVGILIPVFLRVIGWILLFSPQIGIVNQALMNIFGLSEAPLSLYNVFGMAVTQGISFVPAAFFMLAAAYRAIDPALEEAAYTSGASKLQTVLRVNVPLTLPAILGVMIYLLMTAISVFETPALLGLPSRTFVLSSAIYFAVTPQTGLPKYGLGATYGLIMMALGLLASYLYFRVVSEGKKYAVISGKGYRPRQLELGSWKWAAIGFVAFYFALEIFLPFAALIWASLLPYLQVPSAAALRDVTLANYFTLPSYVSATPIVNTVLLVIAAPTLTIILSLAVSWIVVRSRSAVRGPIDMLAFLPHAIPSIVFAVALAWLALTYRTWLPLYGSIVLIIIAHTIAQLAYGTRTMNSTLIQVHSELEEAGKLSGANGLQVFHRILLPLVAGAVFNAWLWLALLSYREVTMALVLYSPASEVLPTLIWKLWASSSVGQVSALGVLLILLVTTIVFLLRSVFTRVQRASALG